MTDDLEVHSIAGLDIPRRVHDLHEIEQVLRRCCVAIDSRAPELLLDCFTPDACLEFDGIGTFEPLAYVRLCAEGLPRLDVTHHQISPPLVHLRGGAARTRCDFIARHGRWACSPNAFMTIGGWYDDHFRRDAAGWRIARRRAVTTWADGNPDVLDGMVAVGIPAWSADREPPSWLRAADRQR